MTRSSRVVGHGNERFAATSVTFKTMSYSLAADAALARHLCADAGRELLMLRDKLGFSDAAALRREGDARAHELLMTGLSDSRPGDSVMSEEGQGEQGRVGVSRLSATRVWIVDPLDGTKEYGLAGRDDWAVHVALWADGELRSGAVALPALNRVLSSDEPPTVSWPQRQLRIAVSRTRQPAFMTDVAAKLDAKLVPMGSAGAKVSAVVLGQVDAYVHNGGQYEWDSAAPVAVARAAGLHTSRIDGSELIYNKANPRQPDVVVCRPDAARELLAVIAHVRAA